MKYFLHLAYKGTHYQGWQRQINGLGVQQVLEEALSRMFKEQVLLHACGRTDAGVHASQFYCHTQIKSEWDFDAVFRINKMLPEDIRVYEFIPVAEKANAQLDVKKRTYEYFIHRNPNPFWSDLSTFYPIDLTKIEEMQAAAKLLLQYQDFCSFCKQPHLYKHTLCEVSFAELSVFSEEQRLRFRITANRFLRAMVRMIVGNLVKIGLGQMTLMDFKALLDMPKLSTEPVFAYPQGLFLADVRYPYILEQRVESRE